MGLKYEMFFGLAALLLLFVGGCDSTAESSPPNDSPEKSLTPWWDGQLKAFASMVQAEVPLDAKCAEFTVTYPSYDEGGESSVQTFTAWLLEKSEDEYHILTFFGDRITLDRRLTKFQPTTLEDQAAILLKAREKRKREVIERSSRPELPQGEVIFGYIITLPEGLVAAWLYERGNKRAAAELLLPRIKVAGNDRLVAREVRDLLGHRYHQTMLKEFSHYRNYERAIQLAKHLSKPVFDGYEYQPRAKKMAQQLARRSDDFKGFRLPRPEAWSKLKGKLSRTQQIEYLASRLRLLNCIQWAQPGDVNYQDEQTEEAYWQVIEEEHPVKVINPYIELTGMNIEVAELPALVPFLADEDYMPTFSYDRDYFPSRVLHKVNWAVADIVNQSAKHNLTQSRNHKRLNAKTRQKQIDRILRWCRENARKTSRELLLETVAVCDDFQYFERAVGECIQRKITEALPIAAARAGDIGYRGGNVPELCYQFNSPEAVSYARKWIKKSDEGVQFWSALILLSHGDRENLEGFAELQRVLDHGDGLYWYPRAIEALLATQNEKALKLACGILEKENFYLGMYTGKVVLQRLLLAGRDESLDYLLEKLSGPVVERTDVPESEAAVDEQLLRILVMLADWHPSMEIDYQATPAKIRLQRDFMKGWLREQFKIIKAGGKPEMKILPWKSLFNKWHVDAT